LTKPVSSEYEATVELCLGHELGGQLRRLHGSVRRHHR
jgi:hypothetical protein